jgi:hypothetical protein
MRKVLGFALVALLAVPLAASAAEVTGKIKAVDRADNAFVLEDGTKLWIDEGRLAGLREGERVLVTFVTQDGKKLVTDLDVRTGSGEAETSNLGSTTSFFDHKSIEASE